MQSWERSQLSPFHFSPISVGLAARPHAAGPPAILNAVSARIELRNSVTSQLIMLV